MHGFNEAIRDLLQSNRAGLTTGSDHNELILTFKMEVQERENPGWVVEYIVDPSS
jgi:hypothetical protein